MKVYTVALGGTGHTIGYIGTFSSEDRALTRIHAVDGAPDGKRYRVYVDDIDKALTPGESIWILNQYNSNEDSFFFGGAYLRKDPARTKDNISYYAQETLL